MFADLPDQYEIVRTLSFSPSQPHKIQIHTLSTYYPIRIHRRLDAESLTQLKCDLIFGLPDKTPKSTQKKTIKRHLWLDDFMLCFHCTPKIKPFVKQKLLSSDVS